MHDRVLAFGNHGSHWLTGQEGLSELRASMQPIEHDAAALSDEQATFAVLGDVALLGIRRAELQIDESVAIFGQGVVGQLTTPCAAFRAPTLSSPSISTRSGWSWLAAAVRRTPSTRPAMIRSRPFAT